MGSKHVFSSFRYACSLAMRTLMVVFCLTVCRPGNSQEIPWHARASDKSESVAKSTCASPIFASWPEPRNQMPMISASAPPIERAKRKGVNWEGVLLQSATFLAIEQGYRLATQPGTRNALKGKFFDDWFTSVKATHGWGDGDDFLTNYIGHPMQGSVAANIFVQNDPNGRNQVFNWTSPYWNSRLKATAWSALYSTQFELGPISEATIGNVGYPGHSLSGAVDLVVTPLAGLGWQVGEDALDKYLVVRIETWTQNRFLLLLARSFLNPTRAFANMMRMEAPWARDTRPGIFSTGREVR